MTATTDPAAILAALTSALTAKDREAVLRSGNPNLPEKAVKDGAVAWKNIDVGIEHVGTKITLPAEPGPMPIDDAIAALARKKADLETEMSVHEVIDAFPLDGAVAFVRALERIYGWATSAPVPGFWGAQPPRMITVDVGPGPTEKIQVPWGGFKIPGVEKQINTAITHSPRGSVFVIYGTVKKRDVETLKRIAELTRTIVKDESIYRGKAIRLRSISEQSVDLENPPEFMDLSAAREDELILPRAVEVQIKTNIWTLIERTQACRDAGIPLKRGVLLSGKYGTGKTLTSLMTARKCVEHGWTFVSLDRAQGLKATLEFARRYEPCVIFAEDIDRATTDRDENTNDLLNTIDGVLSKSAQIMVVMTTNHIERINPAMLRPGRLDAVVAVEPPDAEAVERLLRIYGRSLIKSGEKLGKVAAMLSGSIPAMVREVVERSKLAAISAGDTAVTQAALIEAATGMQAHMALLADPAKTVVSPEEMLGRAVADVVARQITAITSRSTSVVLEALDQLDDLDASEAAENGEAGAEFRDVISRAIASPSALNGATVRATSPEPVAAE